MSTQPMIKDEVALARFYRALNNPDRFAMERELCDAAIGAKDELNSFHGAVAVPRKCPDRIRSLMVEKFGKHGSLQSDAGYQVQAWLWMGELYDLIVSINENDL